MDKNAPRDPEGEVTYPVRGWIQKLRYGLAQAKKWQDQAKGGSNEGNVGRG